MRELLASTNPEVAGSAQWWLQFRKTNDWKSYLTDWHSPTDKLLEAQPEALAYYQQLKKDNAGPEDRRKAAQQLAGSKTGKLYLIDLAAAGSLPESLKAELADQMLADNDRNF